MHCSNCGARLDDDARFCPECGTQQQPSNAAPAYTPPPVYMPQEPVNAPPVYEQPQSYQPQEPVYAPPAYEQQQEPVYAPPAYEQPQEPVYTPPAYEQPQSYQPQEQVYAPPAYEQPTGAPPMEQVYAPPVYEQQQQFQAQGTGYTPPVYDQTPGVPPQGAGYPPYANVPPQAGAQQPPPKKKGGVNPLAIIIPIAAAVVVLGALFLLEFLNVIDIIPSWPSSGATVSSERDRDRDRRRDDEDEEDVRETPSPTTPAAPTEAPVTPVLPSTGALRGGGGEIRINRSDEIEFTPDTSGGWVISTSNNGGSDPYLELYDSRGNYLAYDDDSGGDYNALMIVILNAGETYTIHAGFYNSGEGTYMLNVAPAPMILAGGDTLRVDVTTRFVFIPRESGMWEFSTSDNRSADPFLEIYDEDGNYMAYDDDSGGNYNALINVYMSAGSTYIIKAGFVGGEGYDAYTLNVRPAPESVATPGTTGYIPGEGGLFIVEDQVEFTFTPYESGIWTFFTTDNGYEDPYLEIYNEFGLIAEDDDSGEDYNAFIVAYLDEGVTYRVVARLYGYGSGSFNLHVKMALWLGSTDITFNVTEPTTFVFVPEKTGIWDISTANNYGCDPFLHFYDVYGELMAYDDDSGGMLNAYLSVYLEEWEVYFIFAGFYEGGSGSYDVVVAG